MIELATVLVTPRLTLRKPQPADLADLHLCLSNPQAMRYWSTPEHETIDQTATWLASMIAADPAVSDDFLITRQGRVIGKAGMWQTPEVGFLLHPDHWRQGLAHEAMSAVIEHLFATRDLPHLVAEADPRNAGSLGLLARLGFVETHRAERTMQWRDEWCDSVYLRLDRPATP